MLEGAKQHLLLMSEGLYDSALPVQQDPAHGAASAPAAMFPGTAHGGERGLRRPQPPSPTLARRGKH